MYVHPPPPPPESQSTSYSSDDSSAAPSSHFIVIQRMHLELRRLLTIQNEANIKRKLEQLRLSVSASKLRHMQLQLQIKKCPIKEINILLWRKIKVETDLTFTLSIQQVQL